MGCRASARQFEALKREIVQRVEVENRQAVNREHMLQQNLNQSKYEFDSLNSRTMEYKALKLYADADKTLYEELTKKINEAGIKLGVSSGSSILSGRSGASSPEACISKNQIERPYRLAGFYIAGNGRSLFYRQSGS